MCCMCIYEDCLCSRYDLYRKMVSQDLEQLEEQHEDWRTRDEAAEMGEKHCVFISR